MNNGVHLEEEEEKDQVPTLGLYQSWNKTATDKFAPQDWKGTFDDLEYLDDEIPIYSSDVKKEIIFLCLHGAGLSALSFALLAQEFKGECGLIAFDYRSHGDNRQLQDAAILSLENLLVDTLRVFTHCTTKYKHAQFIVLGHSMGGCIASRFGLIVQNKTALKKRIAGLLVLDMVETSALESLQFMETQVSIRPRHFATIDHAIEWSIYSKYIRNINSAKISIPSQIRQEQFDADNNGWGWRMDLKKSIEYWREWFIGHNQAFIAIQLPKLLILSSGNRLDKDICGAVCQRKFRVDIMRDVGHIFHEDDPVQTADCLRKFLRETNLLVAQT